MIEVASFLDAVAYSIDSELEFESSVLSRGHAVWSALKYDQGLPKPDDIDPLEFPVDLLPHIQLLDVEHEPRLRFRWRLIGTHVTESLGRDSTGKYWDEYYDPKAYSVLTTGALWVLENRKPIRVVGRAQYTEEEVIKSESVDMPLSYDGKKVDRIIMLTDFGAFHRSV